MSKTLHLLALDLGAESGRAMLASFDGERLRLREIHRFPNTPVRLPDGLHWNILGLFDEIKKGIRLAVQQGEIASLGVDTWGVDFGLLDANGALLGIPHHYRDRRTDGMLELACRKAGREFIFEQTGIQFLQLNSLYQLLAMAESGSPALRHASTFLTIPDLLNYWLTGVKACEFSNATTTQCYNPRSGSWAAPLLDRLGIPAAIFPEILPPGTMLGGLLPHLAEETGAALRVIAPACHDTGSAVAAVPAESGNFAYLSSGTWSLLGVELPQPRITPAVLAANFTNEGGVAGTFRFLKNIAGLWIVQECRRAWQAEGADYSYAQLAEMAAAAAPFQALINPDDPIFLPPGGMPERIAEALRRTGQPVPAERGALIRCALESLALKYRRTLDLLAETLGSRPETLHIVGGGSQNRLLNQFTADACNLPVVAGPAEATALGNALVQLIALGEVTSLAEGRALIRRSFPTETFTPQQPHAWDAAYERFLALG